MSENLFVEYFKLVGCDQDLPGAKFKIGQKVYFVSDEDKITYVIAGVNFADEDLYEYALYGYPYLVWEKELQEKLE
jgi:hypothetical protein